MQQINTKLGRRMQTGRYSYDNREFRMRTFITYCPQCTTKVFLDRQDLAILKGNHKRDSRSLSLRLYRAIEELRGREQAIDQKN